jgi:rhodanese-related sulfurtransferase
MIEPADRQRLPSSVARADRAPRPGCRARRRGGRRARDRHALCRATAGQRTIPGSVHVPLSILFWRLDPASGSADPVLADLERQVIPVCAHGYSSSIAAATLRDLGFSRASDLEGGFQPWQEAGLPIEVVAG